MSFTIVELPFGLHRLLRCIWATGLTITLLAFLPACSTQRALTTQETAQSLNAQGIAAKDPHEAKRLFEHAVQIDPLYGPAVTNLGIAFLHEGNDYQAAVEFDQAIKLLPADPRPRVYLGVVYENAGQYPQALEQFNAALEVAPNNMEAIQAAARTQVRSGNIDDACLKRMELIASQSADSSWRTWAQSMLSKYDSTSTAP